MDFTYLQTFSGILKFYRILHLTNTSDNFRFVLSTLVNVEFERA